MQKEEQILFPVIKELTNAEKANLKREAIQLKGIDRPMKMMKQEHDETGQALQRLRELTDGYQPPSHACNTYRVLYKQLRDFEADLQKHIHLENNLLFPRAEELVASILDNK
jgi:regulator of cell morphogenesis and NO signaling